LQEKISKPGKSKEAVPKAEVLEQPQFISILFHKKQ
jgi:hypothetical protein